VGKAGKITMFSLSNSRIFCVLLELLKNEKARMERRRKQRQVTYTFLAAFSATSIQNSFLSDKYFTYRKDFFCTVCVILVRFQKKIASVRQKSAETPNPLSDSKIV
jgi:hypothetical protein